jgi:hypothetical protein
VEASVEVPGRHVAQRVKRARRGVKRHLPIRGARLGDDANA